MTIDRYFMSSCPRTLSYELMPLGLVIWVNGCYCREGEALYPTQGTTLWHLDPASARHDMGEPDGALMVEEVLAQMSEWSDTPWNSPWRA